MSEEIQKSLHAQFKMLHCQLSTCTKHRKEEEEKRKKMLEEHAQVWTEKQIGHCHGGGVEKMKKKKNRRGREGMIIGDAYKVNGETADIEGTEKEDAFVESLMELTAQYKLSNRAWEAARQWLLVNMPRDVADAEWKGVYKKIMGDALRERVAQEEDERNQETKATPGFWNAYFEFVTVLGDGEDGKYVVGDDAEGEEDPFPDMDEGIEKSELEKRVQIGDKQFVMQVYGAFLERLQEKEIDVERNALMAFYAIFFVGKKPYGADEWFQDEAVVKRFGGALKAKDALEIVKGFGFSTDMDQRGKYVPSEVSIHDYKQWLVEDWKRLLSIVKFKFINDRIITTTTTATTEAPVPEQGEMTRPVAASIAERMREYRGAPIRSALFTDHEQLRSFTAQAIKAPESVSTHFVGAQVDTAVAASSLSSMSTRHVAELMSQFNGAQKEDVKLGAVIDDLAERINNTIEDGGMKLRSAGDKVSAFVASRLDEGYKDSAWKLKFGTPSAQTKQALRSTGQQWSAQSISEALTTVLAMVPAIQTPSQ
jgi:hypothetical protein